MHSLEEIGILSRNSDGTERCLEEIVKDLREVMPDAKLVKIEAHQGGTLTTIINSDKILT